MNIHVEFAGEYTATSCTREEFGSDAAAIMAALLDLEKTGCGISDPAVSVELDTFTLTIELSATAATFQGCDALIDSCIRSAIHTVGGKTPNWDIETRQRHTELVDA